MSRSSDEADRKYFAAVGAWIAGTRLKTLPLGPEPVVASSLPMEPKPQEPVTLASLARLNEYDKVIRALDLLTANGKLSDYDDELANRVEDAKRIVRGVCELERTHEPNYAAMKPGEMLHALGDDAYKWATAFCQFIPSRVDHATMLTWFANAIETAHDVRVARMAPPTDPCAGGLVRVPPGTDSRHVLLADNTWKRRDELSSSDRIREYGGGALLGSGQIVPMESIMIEIPVHERPTA